MSVPPLLSSLGLASGLVAILVAFLSNARGEVLVPVDLKCERLGSPVGVEPLEPRLSWRLDTAAATNVRGLRQTGYQILVASSPELLAGDKGDLWDSGLVESDRSIEIKYEGKPLRSAARYYWKVRVRGGDQNVSAWSAPAQWEMGFLKPEDWQARWITAEAPKAAPGAGPKPNDEAWMRQMFTLDDVPQSAIARVNVLGWFELNVNGVKVGPDVLSPSASNFAKRSLYLTYDLKPYLRKGVNCIGLWISRGWYWGGHPGVKGERAVARLQLDMTVDGKPIMMGTDDSWRCKPSGRSVVSTWGWKHSYGGEEVDARLDDPKWCLPESPDEGWVPVTEVSAPAIPAEAQRNPADNVIRTLPPVACTARANGTYTLDFGTNLAGWLNIRLPHLKAGQIVTFHYSDLESADAGTEVFGQRDTFISAGKENEVFSGKFNYHGFRFVTIDGLPAAPELAGAQALAIGAPWESRGSFECSNPLINRMHEVNLWTLHSLSTGGYLSDCPHRERLGYGDAQASIESCVMNFDMARFYQKWLTDWRDVQKPDGYVPHTAPQGNGGGGPGWGATLQQIAWRQYLYYGDCRTLAENYDASRRHVEALESRMKDGLLRPLPNGGKWDFLGDWLAPSPADASAGSNFASSEEDQFFNNCYLVHLLDQLSRIAVVLNHPEDAIAFSDRADTLRKKIQSTYYQPDKKYYISDKQAYLVLPLQAGVTPENLRDTVNQSLADSIRVKSQGHLDTGMLGTRFLIDHLQEADSDLLWTIVTQTTYPGWGYMLEKGATTWWEQWDAHSPSRIHSCFSGLDQWFYQGLAGIRPDASGPGFKKILIQPAIVGGRDLTWVKALHDSPYGRIVSEWKRTGDNQLNMRVVIPINTTATIHVPARDVASVTEGGKPASESPGLKFLRVERSAIVFEAGSGTYDFTSLLSQ